jgi:hypothetical protein
MATTLYFVQSDTLPQIKLTLVDEETQLPKNLVDRTVSLHAKPVSGTGVRFSREATYVSPSDRSNGIAYIQWLDGDLNRPAGDYNAEIEIYYPGSTVDIPPIPSTRETVYDLIKLVIREDIADITPLPVPAPTVPSPSAPDPS